MSTDIGDGTPVGQAGPPRAPRGRRLAWVAAALVAQVALIGVAVAPQLSARLTGQEYRLAVAPADPVDPFRGAYVDLAYPGLPSPQTSELDSHLGAVYVPLARENSAADLWKGSGLQTSAPASGPYLSCQNQGWRLKCGIESWFVPQARAAALERQVRGGHAVAVIRVDGSGHATLVE
ncbi:MAG: GDYXXLXY domain-containing protein, partial [Micrococcales bacterium]|nr:GDYXXLXY domain-containing protein [Micrococcales bacterium]